MFDRQGFFIWLCRTDLNVAHQLRMAPIQRARQLNQGLTDVSLKRFEKAEVSKLEVNLAKLQVQALKKEEHLAAASSEVRRTASATLSRLPRVKVSGSSHADMWQ